MINISFVIFSMKSISWFGEKKNHNSSHLNATQQAAQLCPFLLQGQLCKTLVYYFLLACQRAQITLSGDRLTLSQLHHQVTPISCMRKSLGKPIVHSAGAAGACHGVALSCLYFLLGGTITPFDLLADMTIPLPHRDMQLQQMDLLRQRAQLRLPKSPLFL